MLKNFSKKTYIILIVLLLLCGGVAEIYCQARAAAPVRRNITVITEPEAEIKINGVSYGLTDENGILAIKYVSPKPPAIVVMADGFSITTRQLTAYPREVKIPLTTTQDKAELAFQEARRLSLLDRDKAAEAYLKTLEIKPNYPEAAIGYARLLLDARKYPEAENAVQSARKLAPNSSELTVIHARISKENGDEEGAIEKFNAAIKQAGGFQPEANTGLGLLYMERAELGEEGIESSEADFDLAAKYLRAAIDQLYGSADAPVIHQRLGLVYEKQRRYKEAIAVYREFLELYPDSVEATAVESFIVQLEKLMREQ